jgi:hypothetical protein
MKKGKLLFSIGILIILVVLTGCKAMGLTPATSDVELTDSFTSSRFGYSVMLPTGWIIDEVGGPWLDFQGLNPTDTQGIDSFSTYKDSRTMYIGAASRSTSVDGADITAAEASASTLIADSGVYTCLDLVAPVPSAGEPITIGGEEGRLITASCTSSTDGYYLVAITVHGDQVYWFTWSSTPGAPVADTALFKKVLETVTFE